MYALADCNNFFVSCERVFRPDLEHRPVVVLSNNDGCAISRSNEAKSLGIKMGQPYYQFEDLARQNNVVVFSSNFALYGDMSHRVQATLRKFAPSIEVYSIDESFILLEDDSTDYDAWAKQVSRVCRRDTGIPVSVGVAHTKTLAKIASKLCKKYPKLCGGCYLYKQKDVEKVLRKFPLDDVWGIGRRYFKRFSTLGLQTAWDFASKEEAWVRAEMGITGVRTWRELNGVPCIQFEYGFVPKQQICVSRSFAHEITDIQDLQGQVSLFAAMTTEKLRKQHSLCAAVQVFIQTNIHHTFDSQHSGTLIAMLPQPTDSTLEINKVAVTLLKSMYRGGAGYKRAGVVLQDITPVANSQQSLFDTAERERQHRLMEVVDKLNAAEHNSVTLASQHRSFRMNREHLSPEYTTSWNDILKVCV